MSLIQMLNTKDLLTLEKSTLIKEIGDYPQVTGMRKSYAAGKQNSIENFAAYKGKIPPFEPDLTNCLILHERSMHTDLVSCSLGPGNDLIVSTKLKLLLEKYSACNLFQRDQEIKGY